MEAICSADAGQAVRMLTDSGRFLGVGIIELCDGRKMLLPKKVMAELPLGVA
jgi:hypothetical protein